jgi:hypothetical protein
MIPNLTDVEECLFYYIPGNTLSESRDSQRAARNALVASATSTELLSEQSCVNRLPPRNHISVVLLGIEIHVTAFVYAYEQHLFNRFHLARLWNSLSDDDVEMFREYISSAPFPVRLSENQWEDLKMIPHLQRTGRPSWILPTSSPIRPRLESFAQRHALVIENDRFRLRDDDKLRLLKMADAIIDSLLDVPFDHFWSDPEAAAESRRTRKRSIPPWSRIELPKFDF